MGAKIICLAFALFYTASAVPESRIVGGTPTTIEQFPYISAFIYHYPKPDIYIQRCVGSIISSYHILTTAFCFTGAELKNMRIRAGSTNSMEGGVLVDIHDVIKHPDYVETPRARDIAVARLIEPLRMSDTINMLFIPPAGTYIPDHLSTKIVSWGFETEDPSSQLQTLKTISLNKLPLADCQKIFENEDVSITDAVICASAPGKGICGGDSGAPMVYNSVLLGLSSVYKNCSSDDYPDVFTRIDSYTDWIMEVARAPGTSESPLRFAKIF
ncbi:trypsin delta-like [Vanessa atalanta]|uniref:trypsin delta-like n=1 Tax=Vanessa atalanta TaxID=42275 RepID=UPI001FCE05A1|nr:trypsin delta-like [Vanessa atalanta]XP_047540605.1 trypsin delta-like [Vanessa atalanta]